MAPEQEIEDETDVIDVPDEETIFLEEMGLGSDGTPMNLGDDAWNGQPWEPDSETGVW
jgi:hypothetical protein